MTFSPVSDKQNCESLRLDFLSHHTEVQITQTIRWQGDGEEEVQEVMEEEVVEEEVEEEEAESEVVTGSGAALVKSV